MTRALLVLRGLVAGVVLALVWALVITPVAWISRAVRGDVLHLRPDPAAQTYWSEPRPEDADGLWAFASQNGKLWMLPVILLLLALGLLLVASETSLVVAFLYPLS